MTVQQFADQTNLSMPSTDSDEANSADVLNGLSTTEAEARLLEVGLNRLPEPRQPSLIELFLRQFLSPFIYILLVAAMVSLAVNQTPSAVFIVAVLLLNATIGTAQEFSAQRSANALRAMVRGRARVLRDNKVKTIDAERVVPGDIVLLASGDRMPADIALFESDDLCVDESLLTGESIAVTKNALAVVDEDAPLGERLNACFAGSVVTRGRGRGKAIATGTNTQIGAIATRIAAPRVSEPPLMIRIRRFTYQVAGAILLAILALAAMMLWRGGYDAVAMVMMGIGLAVSTIPEGLPAALTVALAIGMRRMAKANVIIRKLIAVEALGSCTFICSDKTGTLTVNELTIHTAVLPSGDRFEATGAGIAPGTVTGGTLDLLEELCVTGVLANESLLDYAGGDWVSDGDIVDVAFLVFAKKYGLSLNAVRRTRERLKLIPYESEKAFSASVNSTGEGDHRVLSVKGSPEKILAASTHMQIDHTVEPIDRGLIERQFTALAEQGYRVIALAKRDVSTANESELTGLTFLGLVAMIDPVRPEAKEAIRRCRSGGIEVAMITGDHPATARAIASELGLCSVTDQVVTGADIRNAEADGSDALRDLILPVRVFARIEPVQKELIVTTFENDGHFVAVTGDGVNDAPAMRRANAGVAMGRSGTDVAKEAADLIITDDNFASIVAGVEQGRIVYNNIRKVIALLTATGFSALLLFFLSVLTGLPMPLTAIQLLWLNLVANGLQDVALAFEPKEGGELDAPPRSPNQPIFDHHIIEHVLVAGSVMGVLAFAVFWTALDNSFSEPEARNITLLMMVLFGNVHALSSRSETRSLFSIRFLANPFLAVAVPGALLIHVTAMMLPGLSNLVELAPVPFTTFAMLVCVALLFLAVEEMHKATLRRRARFRSNGSAN